MSATPSPIAVFAEDLAFLISLEKQLGKFYLQLEEAAFSPELAKALSPSSTESEYHLKRLKLIKLSVKKQKIDTKNKPATMPFKINLKNSSYFQDLQIINMVLEFQNKKLAHYQFLHPIAVALAMENEASILEQTITDNLNTNTWLRQIIQNVIIQRMKP